MTDDLIVTLTEKDGHVVVRAEGVIDYVTGPLMAERLTDALACRPPRIVVELSRVTFVDSTGLSLLVSAYRDAAAVDGRVCLAAPGRQLCRLLETTNLDRWLLPYPTVAEATAAFDVRHDGCS
jgi:anti-sigma B factor antagonist